MNKMNKMNNKDDMLEYFEYILKAHKAQEDLIQKNLRERKLFCDVYDNIGNYSNEQIENLSLSETYKDGLREAKQRKERSEKFKAQMIEKFGVIEDMVDERSPSEIENTAIDIAANMIRKGK